MALHRWVLAAVLLSWTVSAFSIPGDIRQLIREGDFTAAEKRLLPGARSGDAEFQYHLAKLYHRRWIDGKGDSEAAEWFQKAADQGHPAAKLQLDAIRKAASRDSTSQPQRSATVCTSSAELANDWPAELVARLQCADISGIVMQAKDRGLNLNAKDASGNTPLHIAISREHVTAARALLDAGASQDIENSAGWTQHMLAQRSTDSEVRGLFTIREEKRQNNIDSTTFAALRSDARFSGWSDLALAVWAGDQDVVVRLLSGAKQINRPDGSGHTALYRALERKNVQLVDLLITRGARLRAEDIELTPGIDREGTLKALWAQAQLADLDGAMICALIDTKGAHPLEAIVEVDPEKIYKCSEPLLVGAVKGQKSQLIRRMRDAGMLGTMLATSDTTGCAALCWALRTNDAATIRMLLDAGAVDQADAHGETTLMLAAKRGGLDTVKTLVGRGADADARSSSGSHALLLAATGGHVPVVEFLLSQYQNVDLKDGAGETALIAAVKAEHLAVAKLLISSGASLRANNNRFENARGLIEAKSDPEWLSLMQRDGGLFSLAN